MADFNNKMERTWLCSVVFMDIVRYSSQSVELQMKSKKRFNRYLAEAIQEVPESDRVILDTGDGAAVCFLGAPEAVMFAALQLCRSFTLDDREHQPGLRVRLGVNLGPVKLIRDINGALNVIGDGLNTGQRIMSFAAENQILVSQSFFEVVSRLSDDYRPLFRLKGVEKDKHVREHTVYHLVAPGPEMAQQTAANSDGQAIIVMPTAPVNALLQVPTGAPTVRWTLWLVAAIALAAVAAAGVWLFRGASPPAAINIPRGVQGQTTASGPVPAVSRSDSHLVGQPAAEAPPAARAFPAPDNPSGPSQPAIRAPVTPAKPKELTMPAPSMATVVPATPLSSDAKAAYDDGMRLIDENKPAEAAHRFDDALRAKPDYVDAYAGRAEARRMLLQYDLSLADCGRIIQLNADDARGYNCRGLARQLLRQLDAALNDFNEAIRLKPNFIIAWEHRGTTYELLQQYDRALQDYNEALRLAPRNPLFYVRRGSAYGNLKQYDKAIHDYTESIRLQPNNMNAYRLRALAEDASGDTTGAAADRAHLRESPKRKIR